MGKGKRIRCENSVIQGMMSPFAVTGDVQIKFLKPEYDSIRIVPLSEYKNVSGYYPCKTECFLCEMEWLEKFYKAFGDLGIHNYMLDEYYPKGINHGQ